MTLPRVTTLAHRSVTDVAPPRPGRPSVHRGTRVFPGTVA